MILRRGREGERKGRRGERREGVERDGERDVYVCVCVCVCVCVRERERERERTSVGCLPYAPQLRTEPAT